MHHILFLVAALVAVPSVVLAQTCPCPVLNGVSGVYAGQAEGLSIECAYPDGACVWDDSGTLLNTNQPNCQRYITPYSCPAKDETGQSGVLIHHLISYQCVYSEADGDEIDCSWNAIGQSLYDEPDCDGLTVPPCYSD